MHFYSKYESEVKVKSLSPVRLFATPRTVVYQAPPSMGFSSKDTGVGWHALLQGIFLTHGCIKPASPTLTGIFFTTEPPGKPTT